MMARSGNKDEIEHVRKMFTEFTENLITRVNFLNPFFIHVTPTTLYHVHRGKILTDVIVSLESPAGGISRLNYINPVAGQALEGLSFETY